MYSLLSSAHISLAVRSASIVLLHGSRQIVQRRVEVSISLEEGSYFYVGFVQDLLRVPDSLLLHS